MNFGATGMQRTDPRKNMSVRILPVHNVFCLFRHDSIPSSGLILKSMGTQQTESSVMF